MLIFAAVAERYVEIIADGGINAKVTQEVWDKAVASLIAAIKDGRPADGFVAAIEQCGAVLAEHFPVAPGTVNPDETAGQAGGDLNVRQPCAAVAGIGASGDPALGVVSSQSDLAPRVRRAHRRKRWRE